jgi:hypothetical protein
MIGRGALIFALFARVATAPSQIEKRWEFSRSLTSIVRPRDRLLPALRQAQARNVERRATGAAVNCLRSAGFDPLAALDPLSKISYQHQPWSKAIVADDLLSLRAVLEAESGKRLRFR